MKTIRWILTLLPLLLAPALSQADVIGSVAFGPSLDGTTNPKEFALAVEKTWSEFGVLVNCGLLFESETNGYCSIVPGVHIETESGIFVRAGAGPAYVAKISNPRISSHWNVNINLSIGVYRGPAFAFLNAGHISNGGAVGPNLGDDHGLVGIGWRFGYHG